MSDYLKRNPTDLTELSQLFNSRCATHYENYGSTVSYGVNDYSRDSLRDIQDLKLYLKTHDVNGNEISKETRRTNDKKSLYYIMKERGMIQCKVKTDVGGKSRKRRKSRTRRKSRKRR